MIYFIIHNFSNLDTAHIDQLVLDAGGPTEDGYGPGWLGHQVSKHLETHDVVAVAAVVVGQG